MKQKNESPTKQYVSPRDPQPPDSWSHTSFLKLRFIMSNMTELNKL